MISKEHLLQCLQQGHSSPYGHGGYFKVFGSDFTCELRPWSQAKLSTSCLGSVVLVLPAVQPGAFGCSSLSFGAAQAV